MWHVSEVECNPLSLLRPGSGNVDGLRVGRRARVVLHAGVRVFRPGRESAERDLLRSAEISGEAKLPRTLQGGERRLTAGRDGRRLFPWQPAGNNEHGPKIG